jgi:hypothetical protein
VLEKLLKPEAPEHQSLEAPEKRSFGSSPIRHSGNLECDEEETFEVRIFEALDKRHLGKHLVLAWGHMIFEPK